MITLDKFKAPDTPIDFVDYFRKTYGLDVNTLEPQAQQILAYFKEYGASQAIMMFLESVIRRQQEQGCEQPQDLEAVLEA